MKRRLLDLLVCPNCHQSLDCKPTYEDDGEIIDGELICVSCQQTFKILRGIPRFISVNLSQGQQRTAQAFGWQWTHFTEMHDRFASQFLDWIFPIQPDFFKSKTVLDAGCGIGRHVYYSAQYGAADVIGLDISTAVETAFENVGRLPNVHIVQADIMHPPFRPQIFSFIYSIGVLHHMPVPQAGFNALVPLVKPQGTIFAWVYGYENNALIRHILDPLRKRITSRLPFSILRMLSFSLTVLLQIVVKGIYRPLNAIKFSGLPYNDYLYHISSFGFRQTHTIVFDHLVAPTAFYLKQDEFKQWFTEAGLEDIEITWRNQNSWRGKGVSP